MVHATVVASATGISTGTLVDLLVDGDGEDVHLAAVQITCYDRDGKEVKRVTSTSGDVEDPENENQNGGGDSGNTSQTGGGLPDDGD